MRFASVLAIAISLAACGGSTEPTVAHVSLRPAYAVTRIDGDTITHAQWLVGSDLFTATNGALWFDADGAGMMATHHLRIFGQLRGLQTYFSTDGGVELALDSLLLKPLASQSYAAPWGGRLRAQGDSLTATIVVGGKSRVLQMTAQ